MGRVRKLSEEATIPELMPARDPEERLNQLVGMSFDRAEERLRNGTASSQEIVYFLKLGTEERKLEKEKLENENKLLLAKVAALEAQKQNDIDYAKVLDAITRYGGIRQQRDEDEQY